MPQAAPAAPARGSSATPILVVVGVLVIVAVIAGVGYYAMNNGSKGSPVPSGSHGASAAVASPTASTAAVSPSGGKVAGSGSIIFSPSTFSCDQTVTLTITLPATVKETDEITLRVDGTSKDTHTVVDEGMTKQADGTWYVTSSGTPDCSIGVGHHTEQLVDQNGNVLAEGSFTITGIGRKRQRRNRPRNRLRSWPRHPSTATIVPSSFSCSAATVQVVETIRLPSSLHATTPITAEIDGDRVGLRYGGLDPSPSRPTGRGLRLHEPQHFLLREVRLWRSRRHDRGPDRRGAGRGHVHHQPLASRPGPSGSWQA